MALKEVTDLSDTAIFILGHRDMLDGSILDALFLTA
jgi:hypothetical protein